ncbi:MAG: hypothetical protein L0Z55_00465, partial [Planctomycetes bacterium]|nr:hypothetical protein [Planctomycetota bacterium]
MLSEQFTRTVSVLRRVFDRDELQILAEETKFCRRNRKVEPLDLLVTFVRGLGSDAVNSLTQFSLLYEETSGVSISNKAFYDRL